MPIDRTRQPVRLAALALIALIALAHMARAGEKPVWERVSLPKPGLPKILTKPAKVDQELPPKEAAKACIATAKDLLDKGFDREATLLFERARQLDPKQTEVSRFLAVLYDRQNDPLRANAEYERALKLTPKDADLLNDVGYFNYHRGKLTDAEKWFRDALAQNPKLERAKINLGVTLGRQGRFKEAYEVFADAVGPAAAHSNVGVLLAGQKRYPEAIDAFQRGAGPRTRACSGGSLPGHSQSAARRFTVDGCQSRRRALSRLIQLA